MAIDIKTETLFPFTEINKHWKGKSLHINTFRRLANKGITIPGRDEPLKLETIKLAGTVFCSVQAIERFIEAQNARPSAQPAAKIVTKRRSAAAAELAAIL